MMTLWRKRGIDKLLEQAKKRGTVLCGISAGSICWFNFGNSDSRKFKNPSAKLIKVRGLGFIDAFNCPHYNSESDRRESLKEMMRLQSGVAIALDDGVAIHIFGDSYRIIQSLPHAKAYKIYWKKGTFFEEPLSVCEDFFPIHELLRK